MEEMLVEIKDEILRETNDVELIFVSGSYAFGKMQMYSDIDLKVLTKGKPKKEYVFRFVKHGAKSVLLTVHFYRFSDLLRKIGKPKEWVWAYKSYGQAEVLFDRSRNMDRAKDELEKHKIFPEDFFNFIPLDASYLVEYVGKLRNAYLDKDELDLLSVAHTIAELCYCILSPFNPVWTYTTEKETYRSFLELQNAPRHYVDDFKICYGLTMKRRTISSIYRSAMRLAKETVNFLRGSKIETKIRDKQFLLFFNSKEYQDFFMLE